MLKQVHRIVLFLTLISMLVFSPISIAQNENQIQDIKENGQLNLVQNEVGISDIELEPINTNQVKNVVPDAKKEGRKVINLFLKVMCAVLFSAVILYLVLLFIKKYYTSAFASEEEDVFENLNLTSPTSKEDALKSFLNRTR